MTLATVTPPADSVLDTEALETGDNLFAQSFKPGDLSDEDDIPPMPNATCKMRAGCGVVATYKSNCMCRTCNGRHTPLHPGLQLEIGNKNLVKNAHSWAVKKAFLCINMMIQLSRSFFF